MTAAVRNGVGSSMVGKDPPSLKRLCLLLTMIGWYHAVASFEMPYTKYLRMNQEGLVISQGGWVGFVVG